VRRDQLRTSFTRGWGVESIEPARIGSIGDRDPALAWLASIVRVEAAGPMA
jgi:hypothetical protein